MVVPSYTLYDNEGNHLIISNHMIKGNTFIIFMSGDKKPIYRLWNEHRHLIKGKVYFCCDTGINYFSNHSKYLGDGLYEYTGKV